MVTQFLLSDSCMDSVNVCVCVCNPEVTWIFSFSSALRSIFVSAFGVSSAASSRVCRSMQYAKIGSSPCVISSSVAIILLNLILLGDFSVYDPTWDQSSFFIFPSQLYASVDLITRNSVTMSNPKSSAIPPYKLNYNA